MKKVYLYIILTAFLFGTMETALKLGQAGLDPLQLTFLRFLIGGLVLLPPAVIETRSKGKLSGRDWLYIAMLGFVNIPVSMLLFQFGVNNMNAATAAVIFCINPIFTMMFACLMTGEIFTKHRILAIVIAIAGLIFMAKPWNMEPGNTLLGCVLMLLAAVTFSFYSVISKKMIRKAGTIATTSYSFIIGSLMMLVPTVILDRPVTAGIVENFGVVLYTGIMVTGLGYLFYFLAIRGSDASTGSIAFFLKPAIAPLVAVIVLHEVLHWNAFIGIALILISSYLNMRESKRIAGEQNELPAARKADMA